VVDGKVGIYEFGKFYPFRAEKGHGQCGDLRQTLAKFGAAAYSDRSPISASSDTLVGTFYGIAGPVIRDVVVRRPGAKSIKAEMAQVTDIKGATAVFTAPLPPGEDAQGAVVVFRWKSGKETTSKF
jgi:hypothetical protein